MDLAEILRNGESETVEFKTSFGKEVIISLAAFSNSIGGKVIVGVRDNGDVIGVEVGPETIQRYLNDIEVATYPRIIPNAESFYLMGEIEKYGTGFVRIRKWLKEYPGVFYDLSEKGDFFKVDIRLETIEDGQVADKSRTSCGQASDKLRTSRGQVAEPTVWRPEKRQMDSRPDADMPEIRRGQVANMFGQAPDKLKLLKYCVKKRSTRDMMTFLNLKHRETFMNNLVHPLIREKLLTMTIPGKPRSPKQRYITTSLGREILKTITEKKD